MPESTPFAGRLRKGLVRIDAEGSEGQDAQARGEPRRGLERPLARLETGGESALFRLQLTGGRPSCTMGKTRCRWKPPGSAAS